MEIERTPEAQRHFNSRLPGEEWNRFTNTPELPLDPTAQQRQQFQNGANMDSVYTPSFPFRLAIEIEEHVSRRASVEEYYVGQAERDDWAREYVLHLIDQNAVDPEYIAWQGLQVWRNSAYRRRI